MHICLIIAIFVGKHFVFRHHHILHPNFFNTDDDGVVVVVATKRIPFETEVFISCER